MSTRLPIQFLIVTSLVFYGFHQASAQDQQQKFVDSLIGLLPGQKEDSTKAVILLSIAGTKSGIAQDNGDWADAIKWYQKTIVAAKKANYELVYGRALIFLGKCLSHAGNYAEEIKAYNDAYELSLKNGNKRLKLVSLSNMAGRYTMLGNHKEALQLHLRSFDILKQLPENQRPIFIEQGASDVAGSYAALKNYQEALLWYKKALPEDPRFFYEGALSLALADMHIALGQNSAALENLRAAVKVFPQRFQRKGEMGRKGVAGSFYKEFGEAYFKIATLTSGDESLSSYRHAITYLNKSLELLAEGGGGKELPLATYELLKQAYEELKDYEASLKYTKLYNHLRDSIYNQPMYLKIADLKIQYETEKAALAMKAQREKEQIEEAALREKLLADERFQQEKKLTSEKLYHEKEIATQHLQTQTAIAEEKTRHEKAIAEEKVRQEIMKAEKQRINNMLLMGLILVVITSLFVMLLIRQRQAKIRVVEKADSMRRMAELELQSLRSQLNPHFMFNSLNSIQELILMEENDKSHSYLARFSKLLRMLLENAEKPFVPLQKELEFLQLYLGLESLRVPDLQYSIYSDPSVDTKQTIIPNMILQPYIENAIWHGLSHKSDDKQLHIRIFRKNGTVNYEIEDNGVGRQKAAELKSLFQKQHKSKGMELLSKRFKLLNKEYSAEISTTIADVIKENEVAGTRVTIKVPVNIFAPVYN